MFCPVCGMQLNSDTRICPNCHMVQKAAVAPEFTFNHKAEKAEDDLCVQIQREAGELLSRDGEMVSFPWSKKALECIERRCSFITDADVFVNMKPVSLVVLFDEEEKLSQVYESGEPKILPLWQTPVDLRRIRDDELPSLISDYHHRRVEHLHAAAVDGFSRMLVGAIEKKLNKRIFIEGTINGEALTESRGFPVPASLNGAPCDLDVKFIGPSHVRVNGGTLGVEAIDIRFNPKTYQAKSVEITELPEVQAQRFYQMLTKALRRAVSPNVSITEPVDPKLIVGRTDFTQSFSDGKTVAKARICFEKGKDIVTANLYDHPVKSMKITYRQPDCQLLDVSVEQNTYYFADRLLPLLAAAVKERTGISTTFEKPDRDAIARRQSVYVPMVCGDWKVSMYIGFVRHTDAYDDVELKSPLLMCSYMAVRCNVKRKAYQITKIDHAAEPLYEAIEKGAKVKLDRSLLTAKEFLEKLGRNSRDFSQDFQTADGSSGVHARFYYTKNGERCCDVSRNEQPGELIRLTLDRDMRLAGSKKVRIKKPKQKLDQSEFRFRENDEAPTYYIVLVWIIAGLACVAMLACVPFVQSWYSLLFVGVGITAAAFGFIGSSFRLDTYMLVKLGESPKNVTGLYLLCTAALAVAESCTGARFGMGYYPYVILIVAAFLSREKRGTYRAARILYAIYLILVLGGVIFNIALLLIPGVRGPATVSGGFNYNPSGRYVIAAALLLYDVMLSFKMCYDVYYLG